MRYLLLSVLVVCVIGIMIPSAYSDHQEGHEGYIPPNTLNCTSQNTCSVGYGFEIRKGLYEEGAVYRDVANPIKIATGTTVTFFNGSGQAVTFTSGTLTGSCWDTPMPYPSPQCIDGIFGSDILQDGGEFVYTFEKSGTYLYFDIVSGLQTGIIIVEDNYIQLVEKDEPEPTLEPESVMEIESDAELGTTSEAESSGTFGDSAKEVFEKKKNYFLSIIGDFTDPELFPYSFELERDFTSELGSTESYYELYKLIDSKTNKRVGDLRFYLGSSEWWDNNAELQEGDTSGFSYVFKVKIFLMHKLVPTVAQQMSEHLTVTLLILVPEWSDEFNETESEWLADSLNNAERKEHHGTDKRESIITTENKEIIVLHDDHDYGTMTVIVTENADTISLGSETTGCGAGTVLVDGVCQLISTSKDKLSSKSIEPLYIIIIVVVIGVMVAGWIALAKRGSKAPKPIKQKPKPVKKKLVKKKETSAFCENCGNTLNPTAKFCGKCGTRTA